MYKVNPILYNEIVKVLNTLANKHPYNTGCIGEFGPCEDCNYIRKTVEPLIHKLETKQLK